MLMVKVLRYIVYNIYKLVNFLKILQLILDLKSELCLEKLVHHCSNKTTEHKVNSFQGECVFGRSSFQWTDPLKSYIFPLHLRNKCHLVILMSLSPLDCHP